ncbi:hypothetical protein WQ54_29795 [Bacillus sp. SA1-12]|uniref:hypothetical protein n=1 Tax=Bacillus sp. SA1-12 TaxID=1455638 RepID=UPI0006271457|nr:hypothetical protein [Bacillus sp. SA1-12]KKI88709.1 hypothetical protein WQ54_29795 [Bacillus sp. SA1-12]
MHKLNIHGAEILLTSSRNIDEAGFTRAYQFIKRCDRAILKLKKSEIALLHDYERNSILIERMNTDTFTLHIQYAIKCENVYQID